MNDSNDLQEDDSKWEDISQLISNMTNTLRHINNDLNDIKLMLSGERQSINTESYDTLLPLTKEDYIKIATKYGDKATLNRIAEDPNYTPWKTS